MKSSAEGFFDVGNKKVIAQQAANRVALIVSNVSADEVFISTNPAFSPPEGIRIPIGTLPLMLCRCEVGEYVTRAFWSQDSGGGGQVFVVEVME